MLFARKTLNYGAYWISYFRLIPLLKKINERSVVIDCGANKGDITALFAKKGAQVHAFEPDPLAFRLLSERFKDQENVHCYQQAAWDRDGTRWLYFHKKKPGNEHEAALTVSSSLVQDKINIHREAGCEVATIDIVAFIQRLEKKPAIVKIDIEGAEIAVLKKILETGVYQETGIILAETHASKIPSQKKDVEAIKTTLRNRNIKNIKLNWI